MKKGFSHILVLPVIIATIIALTLLFFIKKDQPVKLSPTPQPSPIPTPITNYTPPTLQQNEAYTIIFLGDSMIDSLGENFDYLREDLEEYYSNTVFGLFNYGFGSTNILSAQERLISDTTYRDKNYQAILDRVFDIIIINSFGHNPLSEYSIEEGLAKQTQALDELVLTLVNNSPNSLIIFMSDIPPSEEFYAKGVVDLTDEDREIWVNERNKYIQNHINYAKNHNIPLIDIYSKSFDEDNKVNLDLINKDNYIHPSSTGLQFMSENIANYLFENNILP